MRTRIPKALDRVSQRGAIDSRSESRAHGVTGTASGCQHVYEGANYEKDEIEFMLAIDAYKRNNNRPFPAWSEVLAIARALGYRKPEPEPIPEVADDAA